MAGTLTLSTLSDGTNSTSATNPILGSAKVWVNFNGTGTVAIRNSYNVSSITDNGTGDYTVNFTTAMPNANYVANVTSNPVDSGTGTVAIGMLQFYNSASNPMTNTSVRVKCGGTGGNNDPADAAFMCVSIFSS